MSFPVDRESYWLRSGEFELATHAHLPRNTSVSKAVLICGTTGFEAIHAYRCMIRLGDALAEAGLAAFRFDYAGAGNSSGDAADANLVSAWQGNIIDQARDLKTRWGFSDVAVVGFRLGATLLSSVLDQLDVSAVTFWEPVTRGKTFVREIRAVAQFAEEPGSQDAHSLESGGFVFSSDTIESIAELSVDPGTIPAGIPVSLVSRGKNMRIRPGAFDNRNPFEELRTREFDQMICEPHYTELPADSIAHITRWQQSDNKGPGAGISRPDLRRATKVEEDHDSQAISETMFRTTDGNLFGIVTRPGDYVPGSGPTVVLSNAGSVCSIGPNRIYVQIARALAEAGAEVIRFDLRNLGDSVTGDVPHANVPYPDSAGEDVARILAHGRAAFGASGFVLAGLCSGSHTSYHFALTHDDPDVHQILLINPLTYYFTPGMSLDNPLQHRTVRNAKAYARSARSAENWRRLLTGQINYRQLAGFAIRVFASVIRNAIRKVSSLWTRHPLSRMDEDLEYLQKRGLKIAYFFSDTDPGYWIARVDSPNTFRKQARSGDAAVVFIKDADHTMSRAHNRETLVARLREHLALA